MRAIISLRRVPSFASTRKLRAEEQLQRVCVLVCPNNALWLPEFGIFNVRADFQWTWLHTGAVRTL